MKHTNTVIHQLLQFIPRNRFDDVVERHQGDTRTRQLSCWTQFVALLFGQLGQRQSLRDLETAFNSQNNHHYHLGVQPIRRSTLADANAKRSSAIYQELFFWLLSQIRGNLGKVGGELIRLVDSTTIDLNKTHFQWARFRSTKAGIKLHTVFDPQAKVPTFFSLTEAKVNDHKEGQKLPFLPGATYVFDRAYNDYAWYYRLDQQQIRFVGRMKRNALFEVIENRPTTTDDILDDQLIRLSSKKGEACPIPLRRIRFLRPEDGKELVFISNDLERTAEQIAALYKQRWEIELFFKWIKQNLKIKRFLGTSENAVRIQVLVAMIAYLLLRMAQLRFPGDHSMQHWARWICVNLMQRRPITEAEAPPPTVTTWQERRHNPQISMAFG